MKLESIKVKLQIYNNRHHQVIKGWDQGIDGMRVGEKRKLVVPSKLGYGKRGCKPDIPPNAVLYFEVSLKRIKSPQE